MYLDHTTPVIAQLMDQFGAGKLTLREFTNLIIKQAFSHRLRPKAGYAQAGFTNRIIKQAAPNRVRPKIGYAQVNDHNKQKIVSYLGVPDLLKVAATDKANRKWIVENCDKHFMRQGHQSRELTILWKHHNLDCPLGDVMLKITDLFRVWGGGRGVGKFANSVGDILGQKHGKKILSFAAAVFDGEVCNFSMYPELNSQAL